MVEKIAGAVLPSKEPLVIEIGPGRGALTEHLLPLAERVIAIEIDRNLIARLHSRFEAAPNLTLIEGDVLTTDLSAWGPAIVAGNLPYYITSPILEKVFALGPLLRWSVFMVQREVAERLAAGPGGRDYGYLSVVTQFFTQPEMLFGVPPSAFSPPPKVDSAVVRLTPRPPGTWDIQDPRPFLEFAGRCFRHKRKTLRNNLAPYYGRERIDALPEGRLRAEQLGLEQMIDLYRRVLDSR
jgi:16S rRNA (adenine1518-N6/adenine1519-N6)-dimethyltransferase